MALDEAEALGGSVPGNSFAHARDEVGLLVLPLAQVTTVETNGDWLRGRWQARTVTRTAGERKDRLGTEFRLESAGHSQDVPTNGRGVQGCIDGQEIAERFDRESVGDERGPLAFEIQQLGCGVFWE